MTLPHSSLGIALIAAVIAAFRSGISLEVVAIYLVLKVSPQIKKSGGFKSGESGDHCGPHLPQVWHSVNLVAKPLAHDDSLPHVVRHKLLFNLYPVRIHVEICDQNSPH